jgi:ubiquinone/menaquinone biosynthesis C-methylase UbiE
VSALRWDHNAYYHGLLLRQLPARVGRALDVGCGAGSFASALASRATDVDAVDSSPTMIEAARRAVPSNVHLILCDVMEMPTPSNGYDAITSISVLHHLPLPGALTRLARWLRPGGVLAAVALPRTDLPRELPIELLGAAGHRILGAGFAGLRRAGRGNWYELEQTHDLMPMAAATLTVREVRQIAQEVLPGAQVRRLAFWRYLLVWHRPH